MFSTDGLYCLLSAFLVFIMDLSTLRPGSMLTLACAYAVLTDGRGVCRLLRDRLHDISAWITPAWCIAYLATIDSDMMWEQTQMVLEIRMQSISNQQMRCQTLHTSLMVATVTSVLQSRTSTVGYQQTPGPCCRASVNRSSTSLNNPWLGKRPITTASVPSTLWAFQELGLHGNGSARKI